MNVYVVRNTLNGREYIGSTIRAVRCRWIDHLAACRRGVLKSPLYEDMRSYGVECFEVTTLSVEGNYDAMIAREQEEIANRGTLVPHGYNVVKGRGLLGFSHSEETKRRISIKNSGRVKSPETLAKMSASSKGRIISAETRSKISAALKGRPKPHLKGHVPANKGVPHTPETRAKMSEASKRRWSAVQTEKTTAQDVTH